jgi:hypothetical protein
MLRFVEIGLFLAPFAGFLVWRLLGPAHWLSPWLLGGIVAGLLLLLAGLLALREQDAGDAGRAYVPAVLQDGRVVPPGARESAVPPGARDSVVPPGARDSAVPPGAREGAVPPAQR